MNGAFLKLAVRVLMRRKVFTAISLFGITLTLLALVVAAALVDGVFAARPPESKLGRSLVVTRVELESENMRSSGPPGAGFLARTVRDLPGAEEITIFTGTGDEAAWVDGRKIVLQMKRTDAAFWSVHDFRFVEGGPYGAQECEDGSAVAVISEGARDKVFGKGPALGRHLEIAGRTHRVLGVAEDVAVLRFVPFAEAWLPLEPPPPDRRDALIGGLIAVLVAREGASLDALRADFDARVKAIPMPYEGYTTLRAFAEERSESVAREILPRAQDGATQARRLQALAAVLAIAFMALPALNLVNLSLSRVLERASEIGIRKAFGATRLQLAGQFVAENVILTLIGAAIAFVLAPIVLRAIDASGMVPGSNLGLSLRVLAAGLACALLFGVMSGAWPAWRMSRLPPVDVLRGRTA